MLHSEHILHYILHLCLVLPNASLMAINPDLVAWGEEAIAASRGHRPSAVQGCSMVSSGGEGGSHKRHNGGVNKQIFHPVVRSMTGLSFG